MATETAAALPTAASGKVSKDTVERAVTALLKWKESQSKDQAPQLLPEDEFVYLNVTLKKIPPKARINPFRISLPYPLHDQATECCLIIDDRPNSNLTSEDAKKIIKSQDIPVNKVLKLSKLKTNYKAFEAKRKLCDSYDLFLVDKRIVHFLPKLLGKHFFKKRKLPLPVDLTKKNWKDQIERVHKSGLFFMRSGTCSVMRVGRLTMESEEMIENVVEAINGVVEFIPKKWNGVRSLHLRFFGSVALPLYQALPDVKLKIMGANEEKKSSDDLPEAKETKRSDGSSKKKRKGRLHEVQYMDDVELGSDDEIGENENEMNQGEVFDSAEQLEEESDEHSEENESEKRKMKRIGGKKGKKVKTQKDLNVEKKSKKARKGDNKEDKKQKQMKDEPSLKNEDESVVKKGKRKNSVGTKSKGPIKAKSKRTKKSE